LNQESAIDKYETEMKARAGKEVRVTVMNTAMPHEWAKALDSSVFKAGLKKRK
jgi:hypothetical protein